MRDLIRQTFGLAVLIAGLAAQMALVFATISVLIGVAAALEAFGHGMPPALFAAVALMTIPLGIVGIAVTVVLGEAIGRRSRACFRRHHRPSDLL